MDKKYFEIINNYNKTDKNTVVVLADSFGGLAIVRELGKHDVPIILIGQSSCLRKSKFCFPVEASGEEEIFKLLKNISATLNKKAVLFTDSDRHLDIIYNNWIYLSTHFLIPSNINNRCLTDKTRLFDYAKIAGIEAPTTYTGDEQTNPKKFPVIVKPLSKDINWDDIGVKKKKVFECTNQESLQKILDEFIANGIETVTQQIILGSIEQLYCVTLYRNQFGAIIPGFIVRKMRQYPTNHGTGTAHLLCHSNYKELLDKSSKLLQANKYVGIAMIEFKYCKKTNEYYIIEVNGRFPLETGITHKMRNDFVYNIYRDMLDPVNVSLIYNAPKESILWIYVLNDIRSLMQNQLYKIPLYFFYLTKYKIQWAIWSLDDPNPFIFFFYTLFQKYLKENNKLIIFSPKKALVNFKRLYRRN